MGQIFKFLSLVALSSVIASCQSLEFQKIKEGARSFGHSKKLTNMTSVVLQIMIKQNP